MGSNSIITNWFAISVHVMILNLSFFSSFSLPVNNYSSTHINSSSIDDYLYNYSLRSIQKWPHTGVLYNFSLPANLSGIEISVLRLRSSTLRGKGANFSSFDIPKRIITMPFVKRLALMYEKFGNLSSHYYELPGYTLMTAVVGLAMYDASDLSTTTNPRKLNITLGGEPIRIMFSHVQEVPKDRNAEHVKCARFDPVNGIVELSNMVKSNVCSSQALGHFAIAMPRVSSPIGSPAPTPLPSQGQKERNKVELWKWRLIGFAAGLSGLILVVSIGVVCWKMLTSRKIKRLERGAERSEALGTTWIGDSKMPSASMTRTQADIFEIDQ